MEKRQVALVIINRHSINQREIIGGGKAPPPRSLSIYCRQTFPHALDYSTFSSVKDAIKMGMDAIKMGMYATNFSKAGYQELSDVAELTEDELLQKVGVRLVG